MKNPFKKKAQTLPTSIRRATSQELIESATKVVDNALSMFTKAVNQVDLANQILNDSLKQSNEKIVDLQTQLAQEEITVAKAQDNVKANNALKAKLSEFVIK
jgi:septal ring factor EnvC (AmiA/AmiB activator)